MSLDDAQRELTAARAAVADRNIQDSLECALRLNDVISAANSAVGEILESCMNGPESDVKP